MSSEQVKEKQKQRQNKTIIQSMTYITFPIQKDQRGQTIRNICLLIPKQKFDMLVPRYRHGIIASTLLVLYTNADMNNCSVIVMGPSFQHSEPVTVIALFPKAA